VIGGVQELGASFGEFLGSNTLAAAGGALAGVVESIRLQVVQMLGPLGFLATDGAGAFDLVRQSAEVVGFTLRNIDDVVQLAGVNMAEAFTHAGETIAWAAGVAGDFGAYLAGNWRSLATDAVNAVSAAVSNLVGNIKSVLDGLAGLARGKGFEVKFKPVLADFDAKTEAFKVREAPALTDFSGQKNEITGRIAAKEAKRKPVVITPADMGTSGVNPAVDRMGNGAAAPASKSEFFGGGQDFSRRIQEGALKGVGGPGDAAQKAAKLAADQLAEQKKTNDLLKDLKDAKDGFKGDSPRRRFLRLTADFLIRLRPLAAPPVHPCPHFFRLRVDLGRGHPVKALEHGRRLGGGLPLGRESRLEHVGHRDRGHVPREFLLLGVVEAPRESRHRGLHGRLVGRVEPGRAAAADDQEAGKQQGRRSSHGPPPHKRFDLFKAS
jgi:hypothetical protein